MISKIAFLTHVVYALSAHLSKRASYPVESCNGFYDSPYDGYSCSVSNVPSEYQCCYENYGILLHTQFWDAPIPSKKRDGAVEAEAPKVKRAADTKFTIHGLWNDLCDSSYKQYCDYSPEIPDGTDMEDLIANQFGMQSLYNTMSEYWLNDDGTNEELWMHEFNKHGTCMNTLETSCFTGTYTQYENAVYFYEKVVSIWEGLDTYSVLANAGITPDANKKYQLSDVQNALNSFFGAEVYVGCTSSAINQIYYTFNLRGNVLTGDYKPIDSPTLSNCPSSLYYNPK